MHQLNRRAGFAPFACVPPAQRWSTCPTAHCSSARRNLSGPIRSSHGPRGSLGRELPRSRMHRQARRCRLVGTAHVRGNLGLHPKDRPITSHSWTLGRAPRRHPLRKRSRTLSPHAGLPPRRNPRRSHLAFLLAALERFQSPPPRLQILTPGLVFVSEGNRYQAVLDGRCPSKRRGSRRHAFAPAGQIRDPFRELAQINSRPPWTPPTKKSILTPSQRFSSLPDRPASRGVINTHRMICSNLQMINQVFGFLEDEPPVLVDWLPWHHTFGGNHNIGIALYNGGTFYSTKASPLPA